MPLFCCLRAVRQDDSIEPSRHILRMRNPTAAETRTSEREPYTAPGARPTMQQDAELIARLRRGEESAVAELYDRYSGIVYSVALRVLADTTAAEDILQEVFLQLWRDPERFDSRRGSLGAWLAVMSRNRAIDVVRKRRPASTLEDVVIPLECNLENEVAIKQLSGRARAALQQIPPEQRSALEMAFFQGLTHSEIAEKTGEPLGTIKTRIRAGLMALRKSLGS